MKQRIKSFAIMLGLILGISSAMLPAPAGAINVFNGACKGNNNAEVCKAKSDSINPLVQTIINTLLFAVGIIAVIMIIIGGIRYVSSNGDSSQITSAKNTIMYSVIGLIVSLMAFAIVSFVVGQFK